MVLVQISREAFMKDHFKFQRADNSAKDRDGERVTVDNILELEPAVSKVVPWS